MRRVRSDLSYKERTRDIIDDSFEPWQLSHKEEREGIHRTINRVVSFCQEFDKERLYVENMFFPSKMDLSEEHMLYTVHPNARSTDLYYNGNPINNVITKVETSDELIAGEIDVITPKSTMSGIIQVESIVAETSDNAHILSNGYLYQVDLLSGNILSSGAVTNINNVSYETIFDVNNRYYAIDDPFISSSISVVTSGGVEVPFEVYTLNELNGIWNPDFDIDNNGVIWENERSTLDSITGSSMNSATPEEWTEMSWADVDKDGLIGEQDYNSVNSSIPSVSPDKYGVIKVPYGYNGMYTVGYTIDEPYMSDIHRAGNTYEPRYTKTALENYLKITYDENTNIYYAIDTNGKSIRALTYEEDLDNVVGDVLIYTKMWDTSCTILDLDLHSGYIFLLVTDGNEYKLIYDDIWREYVESIELSASITVPEGMNPEGFSISQDGYVILYEGNRIELLSMDRDRYADLDGTVYFNIRRNYTDSEGIPYITVPSPVFNSFDSFAYSLGIHRPWGKDNLSMRNYIYDFYTHTQSNSTIGMSYGITRELGFDNVTTINSGEVYYLPTPLYPSGSISINEEEVQIISSGENHFILSGSVGTLKVDHGNIVTPDETVTSNNSYLDIEGYYLDGDGYPVRILQTLFIESGTVNPTIESRTLADMIYLESKGLAIDGELTSEMITVLETAEDNSPFIYKNSSPNATPMDIWRLSNDPISPTIMSPNMSGIVSDETDSEVSI